MLKKLFSLFRKNPTGLLHNALRNFETTLAQLQEVSAACDARVDAINIEAMMLHDERARLNATNCRAQTVAAKLQEMLG